jgi:hypothetical protein
VVLFSWEDVSGRSRRASPYCRGSIHDPHAKWLDKGRKWINWRELESLEKGERPSAMASIAVYDRGPEDPAIILPDLIGRI